MRVLDSMNALDLSAPASDALIKTRRNAWVQLAGHPGAFAPAGPNTIWKRRLTKDNSEVKAYQALMEDEIKPVVPKFHREVEYNNEFFIEIEDLLQHFTDPNIMDIKMGVRTFLESEVKNPVLRKDLYDKMINVDPTAPTSEEHEQKAVTKLRYMQFRERESSTAELGFRIEAIRMSGEPPMTDLKKTRTQDQVACQIYIFLNGFEAVRAAIAERLVEIRDKFASSEFFKLHEIIGSSLLLMYDGVGNSGGWMIDFAKTLPIQDGMSKTHTKYWTVGSYEDGYVLGIDNLILVFQKLGEDDYVAHIQSMLREEQQLLLNTIDVTIENQKAENHSQKNVVSPQNSSSPTFLTSVKSPEFDVIPEEVGHSENKVNQGSANAESVLENLKSAKEGESSLRNDRTMDINSTIDSETGNTDSSNNRHDRFTGDEVYIGETLPSVSAPGNGTTMLSDVLDTSTEQRCMESEHVSRTDIPSHRPDHENTEDEILNSESVPETELIDTNNLDIDDCESGDFINQLLGDNDTFGEPTTTTATHGDYQPEAKCSKLDKVRVTKTDSLISDSLHSEHNSDDVSSRDSQTSPT